MPLLRSSIEWCPQELIHQIDLSAMLEKHLYNPSMSVPCNPTQRRHALLIFQVHRRIVGVVEGIRAIFTKPHSMQGT